jgi:hypothetical protein
MRICTLLSLLLLAQTAHAQPAAVRPLVGTWSLASMGSGATAQALTPVRNPIGILIQDAKGNFIEIVTRAGRPAPPSRTPQAILDEFTSYSGFWGSYTADPARASITYHINGDLNPNRKGQDIVQSYEHKGDRLVLTESAPGRVIRSEWDRNPELELISDVQQQGIGFWQWVSAGLTDSRGVIVRPARRDPSVIVYTPTGHMAVVYLPPPGRQLIAGSQPTPEEAQAALQDSVSYFGTYMVQPKTKSVTHYRLAIPDPGQIGSSLLRYFDVAGEQITLKFPPTQLNGQPVNNIIILKRLGGLRDMWPEFRP